MSLEENKLVVRRHFQEMWNTRNLAVAEEITTPEMINHARGLGDRDPIPPSQRPYGIEGTKQTVTWLTGMLPDLQFTIEELVAEGDKVVAFVTVEGTHAASGKRTRTQHIHIFRVENGKTTEHWAVRDDLRALQQMGALTGMPSDDSFMTNE